MDQKDIKQLNLILKLVSVVIGFTLVILISVPFFISGKLTIDDIFPKSDLEIAMETNFFALDYDVAKLGNSESEQQIKYGYELITNTPHYLSDSAAGLNMIYAGNNLACKNCHLASGTKKFAAPYIGVTKRFPNFRGREGKIGTIEDRINGCMERSMNGKRLPDDSKEMQAMVAYMDWLGKGMPEEFAKDHFKGRGFVKIELPHRPVDLIKGKAIYAKSCTSCHQENGQGVLAADGKSYTYPPLWGVDAYNHGAGMHRVITAAQFIKANMPFGATAEDPILTDEEAYDVAGYINSFDRPLKANTEADFPDKKLKPMSTPYPPFADPFDEQQHKYGPYQEIIKYYQKEYDLKKTK